MGLKRVEIIIKRVKLLLFIEKRKRTEIKNQEFNCSSIGFEIAENVNNWKLSP